MLSDDFKQVGDILSNYVGTLTGENDHSQEDKEMAGNVNRYKYEVARFYDAQGLPQNAFTTSTQTLWYQHYLNKQRLLDRKIGIHYEAINPMPDVHPSNGRLPFFSYKPDGKNVICTAFDDSYFKKVWYRDRKVMQVLAPVKQEQKFYLIKSKSSNGKCICPNCGNEASIENMMDGCDYCGTKFKVEDFQGKVSSYYMQAKGLNLDREKNPVKLVGAMMFIFALLFFVWFELNKNEVSAAKIMLPILIIGFILSIIILTIYNGRKGAAKNTITKREIRVTDPNFSMEYFIGTLMNKLSSIHFSHDFRQVAPFFNNGYTPKLPDYSDVIQCDIENYVLTDYSSDDKYQHLSLEVSLILKHDTNKGLLESKEKLRLHLIKNINTKTNDTNDAVAYTCKSCGSSLSLLDGGKCKYCGQGLNLIDFDWVFADYTVI